MSSYYHYPTQQQQQPPQPPPQHPQQQQHHHHHPSNNNHHNNSNMPSATGPSAPHSNRNRRGAGGNNGAPRPAAHVAAHHHAKQARSHARKDDGLASLINFRQRFEAQRSFDLDDDLEFCPNLLTEGDMYAIHSAASSDRSSMSSGSPDSSPQSHALAPESSFSLNSHSAPYVPAAAAAAMAAAAAVYPSAASTPLKLHQPAATRVRSAIPIVNPSTGLRMASPPRTLSPASTHQTTPSRRW